MKKIGLIAAVVAVLTPAALPAGCPRCHRTATTYTYHAPAYYPAYYYYPAPYVAFDPAYDALLQEVRALRADMRRGQSATQYADGKAVLGGRCASCHAPTVADEKGGGFEIDAERLSSNDLKRIVKRLETTDAGKRMPKDAPALPHAEITLVKGLALRPGQAAQ